MKYCLILFIWLISHTLQINRETKQISMSSAKKTENPTKGFLQENDTTEVNKIFINKHIDTDQLVFLISKLINDPKVKLYNCYKSTLAKLSDCYDHNLIPLNFTKMNPSCAPDIFTNNIITNYTTSYYNIYNLEYRTMGNSLLFSTIIFLKKLGINLHNSYMENFIQLLIDIENLYESKNIYYNSVHAASILQKIIVLTDNFDYIKKMLLSKKQKEIYELLMKVLFVDIMKGESRLKKELLIDDKFNKLIKNDKDGEIAQLIGYTSILIGIENNYLNELFFNDINEIINNGNLHKGLLYLPKNNVIQNKASHRPGIPDDFDKLIDILSQSVLFGDASCNQYGFTAHIYNGVIDEMIRLGIEKYRGSSSKDYKLINISAGDAFKFLRKNPSLINIIDLCELKRTNGTFVLDTLVTNSSKVLFDSGEFERAFTEIFRNYDYHKYP
jgi:hypothetical protein